VVATDVGGVAEGVGNAGFLVPPRDPSAVAAACTRLLTDQPLRRALARNARDRAVQLFDAERCFAMYRGLYEELGPGSKVIALLDEEGELPGLASPVQLVGGRMVALPEHEVVA